MTPTNPAASSITIGRAVGNQIVMPTLSVSERHARVILQDELLWLEDLNSSNGTFINNFRVLRRKLTPTDRIRLGSQVISYNRIEKVFSTRPDDFMPEFAELATVWDEYVARRTALDQRDFADALAAIPLLGRFLVRDRREYRQQAIADLENTMARQYVCPKCSTPFAPGPDTAFPVLRQQSIVRMGGKCLAGCGAIWVV
jgi:FHA domain